MKRNDNNGPTWADIATLLMIGLYSKFCNSRVIRNFFRLLVIVLLFMLFISCSKNNIRPAASDCYVCQTEIKYSTTHNGKTSAIIMYNDTALCGVGPEYAAKYAEDRTYITRYSSPELVGITEYLTTCKTLN